MGRRWDCQKIKFPTKQNAVDDARRAAKYGAGAMRPYYCGVCDAWHLTSKYTARDQRRIERKRRAA